MSNENAQIENLDRPRLRLLDGQAILHEGIEYLHLRDPLALSGRTLLIPQHLIPLLSLMDGTRDLRGLQAVLAMRFGVRASLDDLSRLIQSLDEAVYLDNPHYLEVRKTALAEYRRTACRPSSEAGRSYPQDPIELHALLEKYLEDAHPSVNLENLRGIISPHIDFERGGAVYAKVWKQAANALPCADLVIILGTDHFSEGFPISLTRQDYCTPFGRLAVDQEAVSMLVSVLGDEDAFRGELHHRSEHSIELAAVWLQHILGGHSVKILPILVGPIEQHIDMSGNPIQDSLLDQLIENLHLFMQKHRTFVVAAGDLAHIGPAFGGKPVTPGDLLHLYDDDRSLIKSISRGDANTFYQKIVSENDRNNVCGTAPIYIALQSFGKCAGKNLAYAACPADVDHTSYVSICGLALA